MSAWIILRIAVDNVVAMITPPPSKSRKYYTSISFISGAFICRNIWQFFRFFKP